MLYPWHGWDPYLGPAQPIGRPNRVYKWYLVKSLNLVLEPYAVPHSKRLNELNSNIITKKFYDHPTENGSTKRNLGLSVSEPSLGTYVKNLKT